MLNNRPKTRSAVYWPCRGLGVIGWDAQYSLRQNIHYLIAKNNWASGSRDIYDGIYELRGPLQNGYFH